MLARYLDPGAPNVEIKSLFGLPAHPLIVHAAVVLLPLAALLVVVVALVPRWRRVGAPLALALALVSTVSVGLAQQSGEALEDYVQRTETVQDHTRQGDEVLPWAILVTIAAGAVLVADPLRRRWGRPSAKVTTALVGLLAVAAGVGATVTVIQVGHSGATAVWGQTLKNPPQRPAGGERDGD